MKIVNICLFLCLIITMLKAETVTQHLCINQDYDGEELLDQFCNSYQVNYENKLKLQKHNSEVLCQKQIADLKLVHAHEIDQVKENLAEKYDDEKRIALKKLQDEWEAKLKHELADQKEALRIYYHNLYLKQKAEWDEKFTNYVHKAKKDCELKIRVVKTGIFKQYEDRIQDLTDELHKYKKRIPGGIIFDRLKKQNEINLGTTTYNYSSSSSSSSTPQTTTTTKTIIKTDYESAYKQCKATLKEQQDQDRKVINQYKEQLAKLKNENTALTKQINEYSTNIKNLQNELTINKQLVSKLKVEKNKFDDANNALKDKYETCSTTKISLEKQLKVKLSALAELEKEKHVVEDFLAKEKQQLSHVLKQTYIMKPDSNNKCLPNFDSYKIIHQDK